MFQNLGPRPSSTGGSEPESQGPLAASYIFVQTLLSFHTQQLNVSTEIKEIFETALVWGTSAYKGSSGTKNKKNHQK